MNLKSNLIFTLYTVYGILLKGESWTCVVLVCMRYDARMWWMRGTRGSWHKHAVLSLSLYLPQRLSLYFSLCLTQTHTLIMCAAHAHVRNPTVQHYIDVVDVQASRRCSRISILCGWMRKPSNESEVSSRIQGVLSPACACVREREWVAVKARNHDPSTKTLPEIRVRKSSAQRSGPWLTENLAAFYARSCLPLIAESFAEPRVIFSLIVWVYCHTGLLCLWRDQIAIDRRLGRAVRTGVFVSSGPHAQVSAVLIIQASEC